jgi:AraC-like DNA-binding protein
VTADIENLMPSVLCFDFDHPDQHRLQALQDVKKSYPRLPILMLTLDHSESLAVWAFRARVWNYLVKPVPLAEFSDSLEALSEIAHRASPPRVAQPLDARVPQDLLVEPIDLRVARLQAALHYVKRCFGEKLLEAEVASLCDMTRFAFSRSFHATFGMTFREYVMRVRVACSPRAAIRSLKSLTRRDSPTVPTSPACSGATRASCRRNTWAAPSGSGQRSRPPSRCPSHYGLHTL